MDNMIKKQRFDGTEVEILGETYEEGLPKAKDQWRDKITDRADMLRYLTNGERYWYSDDWFGSEKRRNPA
jgi:hypothetical protein